MHMNSSQPTTKAPSPSAATAGTAPGNARLEEANEEQRLQILELLSAHTLPIQDITAAVQLYALKVEEQVLGSAGLEVHGNKALLRSVCVADALKGRGWGSFINQQLEGIALEQGIQELYLVTTTAEAFFARRGYSRLQRSSVPGEVLESGQFKGICPASAAIMVKCLG
jgi:amino-acid N-acetyltransferase